MASINESDNELKSGNGAWIALIAAVGVTATAFLLAKKLRASSFKGQVEDVYGRCDRAAKKLDERLGVDLIVA